MNDSAPGAIKGCCLRLMGFTGDPNQAPQNYLDGMSQALQACAQNPGIFGPATVSCVATAGKTKQNKPFCYIAFEAWQLPEGWQAAPVPAQPSVPQTHPDLAAPAGYAQPAPTVQPAAAPPAAPPGYAAPPAVAPPAVAPPAAAPAAAPAQAVMPGQQPWTPPQG